MSGPLTLRLLSGHFKESFSTAKPDTVLFNYSGNVAKVTLNKTKAFNALDLEMIRTLQSEVPKWNTDPNIKAVLFTANGGKAFSAGADIKSVHDAKGTPNEQYQDTFFREKFQLYYSMATMKPIQIAFWDGIVIGAGIGIAMQAPIRIATETSVFSMPEGKIGLHLGIGGGYYFSRLRNHIGTFIGLTGHRLKGAELIQCGVADYYVKRENLKNIEEDILKYTTLNTKLEDLKNIVKKYEEPVSGNFKNEDLINQIFGKATLEEVYQELEQRSKESDFARETLRIIKDQSPLSMKVIFEQLKRGKALNFEENLKMDMRIVNKLLDRKDFYEGIRCLFVDKGSKPSWEHKSIFEVPNSEVDEVFKKLPNNLELSVSSTNQ